MLVHLDKNHLCVRSASESDLYQLMLSIADHTVGVRADRRRPDKLHARRDPDEEVAAIRDWLKRRVGPLKKGERPVTYRQLRQILSRFRVSLGASNSNRVDVLKDTRSLAACFGELGPNRNSWARSGIGTKEPKCRLRTSGQFGKCATLPRETAWILMRSTMERTSSMRSSIDIGRS